MGCFVPFWGITSPSSASSTFLFFFKSRLGSNSTMVTGGGGGGGRFVGTWVLGTSFEVDPLFLLVIKPFKPGLCFKFVPSSSSEIVSGWVTIDLGWWTAENLSDSVSESESSTSLSEAPSLPLLRSGTGRSRWLENGRTRLTPLSEQLLVEKHVGVAAQQGEGLSKPRTQA